MLIRQFHLGNNLPMHNTENTDFPWQKPRQLPSAEAKGWVNISLVNFLVETINKTNTNMVFVMLLE